MLARYLETEIDAVHAGEARHIWSRGVDQGQLCECGRPFDRCGFWSRVLDEAYSGAADRARNDLAALIPQIDRLRHIPSNVMSMIGSRRPSEALQTYGDRLTPLYEAIHRVSGAALVIDSSKDPSYLVALRATQRVDVKVVHLVRDSRAVAYSWTRQKLRPEIHWDKQFMSTLPPKKSARRWMEDNTAVELFGLFGTNMTRVRYEDFATHPGRCLDGLIDELALRRSPAFTRDGARHSFSGNPMRFDVMPVSISLDNAWTSGLSSADRRWVSILTAPLLLKYGYPLS